jgi:glycosyltransferase involved in cell wall biosynthesis
MIKSLYRQLVNVNEKIEIIVRDDSKNNQTKEILFNIQFKKNIEIKYIHGDSPIGLDSASLFLFENASGEFVWLFSDDDEFLSDAIIDVLRIIKKDKNLNLIWVNFDVSHPKDYGLAIKGENSRYFLNANDAIETIGPSIGLISTQIFRRKIGLGGFDIAKKYISGFSFVSTCIYLYVMTRQGNLYFVNGPLILNHPTLHDEILKKTTHTGKIINNGFQVYGLDFLNIVNEFRDSFSFKSYRHLISKNYNNLWKGMVVGWALGFDDPKGKKLIMLKRYWSYPQCWIAIIAFNLPQQLVRKLYKLYRNIKYVQK